MTSKCHRSKVGRVCQCKTISKLDFSIVLTDEGEKSNRCESCVYPAAVFCNIMSIDLLFVPELLGGWDPALCLSTPRACFHSCLSSENFHTNHPTRLTGDIRPKILCYDLMERKKKKTWSMWLNFLFTTIGYSFRIL